MRRYAATALCIAATAAVVATGTRLGDERGAVPAPPSATAVAPIAPIPAPAANPRVRFERNEGQTDGRVRFLHRSGGATVFLTDDGATTRLRDHAVRMRVVGARAAPAVTGETRLPSYSNYFIGNEPANWRSHVPHFAAVRYDNVYPGVDLVYHGANGPLEYDFEVAPGADPGVIELAFEGADVAVDGEGDLIVTAGDREMRHGRPVVYQDGPGGRSEIDGRFELVSHGTARFRLGEYDRALALVIDPIVTFTTYLGGSAFDGADAVGIDGAGAIYVSGSTASTDFPTQFPFQGTPASSSDAYVAKLSPDAGSLVYSTYFGGNSNDVATAIAVTGGGESYIAGYTFSTDLPTQNPFQASGGGATATVFVTRLAGDGASLTYSTYLGGSAQELGTGIAVDTAGAAYVTGYTQSSNFPLQSPIQGTRGGSNDIFVTKLVPDGSALAYSTFLGGSNDEADPDIAVDAAGAAYVAGFTESDDFPVTLGAFQTTRSETGGVAEDAFVTKIDAAGSAFSYSTLLGGSGDERANAVAVDTNGSAYVTGSASSTFPVQNAFQSTNGGNDDAFVTKVAPDGASLVYSTFLGASQNEDGRAIAVDGTGAVYVAGNDANGDFPTSDPIPNGMQSDRYAWAVKLDAAGATLPISTVIGAPTGQDDVFGMAVNALGHIHVVGRTRGAGQLAGPGFQTSFGGSTDAFLAIVGPATDETIGEGTLYASRAAFKINHAQHAKGRDKDSFVIKGCVNPAGANADPTGATVAVTVNGMTVIPATTLDGKGRGASAKGASPAVRVQFKPQNGQFLAQVKNDDLTQELGDLNATAKTDEELSVTVTIANAGLLTDTVTGDLEFSTKSKQNKSSRGAYSFKKGVSQTAVYKALRTQVRESGGGHALTLTAALAPVDGDPIDGVGDVEVTLGDAAPITIPKESLRVTGSGSTARLGYSRSQGEVAGLKKLTYDNRRRTLSIATDALTGTGIPASGDGEPTSHTLDVTIQIDIGQDTQTFGSTLEILRSNPKSGRWKR